MAQSHGPVPWASPMGRPPADPPPRDDAVLLGRHAACSWVLTMRGRIIRLGSLAAIAASAGCLPPLPACDDGCADTGESEGPSSATDTYAPTAGPGTLTIGDSDGSSSGSDEGPGSTGTTGTDDDTSTGTTGEPVHCPSLDPLFVNEDGDIEVTNCRFEIFFGAAEHFSPSWMSIPGGHNDNLLSSDGAVAPERGMGVIVYPALASWRDHVGPGYELYQQGPAVTRIRVDWADDSQGSQFEGRTIYTVTADGRVMRDDFVHMLNGVDGPSWGVSYVSMRAALLTDVQWGGGVAQGSYDVTGAAGTPTPDYFFGETGGGQYGADAYLCAYHADQGDVVGLVRYPNEAQWVSSRATRIDNEPAQGTDTDVVALQSDWWRGQTVENGYYNGNSMLVLDARTEDHCERVIEQYEAYNEVTPVTAASGGGQVYGLPGDDDNDGFSEGGGFYAFTASGGVDLELLVGAGAPIPTALFHIEGFSVSEVAAVLIDGVPLEESEVLLQDAEPEAHTSLSPSPDGFDMAGGLWVLLGQSVQENQIVTIQRG